MTETQVAGRQRGGLLRLIVLLRDLAMRHGSLFMLLWLAGLFALAPLSLLPGTAPPTGLWNVELSLDKVFHVIAYGGLAGIPMLALKRPGWCAAAIAVAFLASVAYEIGQAYVPGRSFGLDDLAANLGGVVLGVVLGLWMRRLPGGKT